METLKEKRKSAARKILGSDEPTFTMLNSDMVELSKALNYYSNKNTYDDSKSWLIEWCSSNAPQLVGTLHKVHEFKITNLGYVCRCIENGFFDPELNKRVLQEATDIVNGYTPSERVEAPTARVIKRTVPNAMLEQYDYAIDAISLGQAPTEIVFTDNNAHLIELKNSANKLLNEINEFQEQYPQWKQLKKFINSILDKVDNVKRSAKVSRIKKAAPKKIDPLKMVSKLVLGVSDPELGCKTLKATTIVGATKLIVWNPERRTLTAFIAMNDNGFLVSGRSIKNFDPEKSITKKIRKPSEMWAAIKDLTATRMHYWLRDTCKTTETPAKALIADGSIILKV